MYKKAWQLQDKYCKVKANNSKNPKNHKDMNMKRQVGAMNMQN